MTVSCYGAGIADLVKLAPEIDVTDKASINEFAADQWRRVARTFGFAESIEPGLQGSLKSGGQLGSVLGVAIAAIKQFLKSSHVESLPKSAAAVRYNALSDASNEARGWMLPVDLDSLPAQGCIDEIRVIPAVNRETYFHPQRSQELTPRDCAWSTVYPVYVGTWPWVYGHALHGNPGTLRWMRHGQHDPVTLCASLYANAWTLAGNAAINGKVVAEHYDWFRKSTDDLLVEVPTEPGKPGTLYRSELGLLRVYMTDPDLRTITLVGPLGRVSAAAYNHILASFAAFFRVRQEIINHLEDIPQSVRNILNENPDSCLQQQINPPDTIGA